MKFKLPKIEKIPEAYSAIADNRITLGENEATVLSSDRTKEYKITWEDSAYSSNDNASYWQGQLGYPVIAVLMLQNKLSLNRQIAQNFQNIPWKKLNTSYKNNYSAALEEVYNDFSNKNVDCEEIKKEIDKVYEEITKLDIELKRGKLK